MKTLRLEDAMFRINNALRSTDDSTPEPGDGTYESWLDTLNRKKDELYFDVGKQWAFIYNNRSPNEPGTVATTATTTLTGTDTYFEDYRIGDKITVDGETVRTIATIVSDTVLTVTVAFSNTASGKTFTHDTIIEDGVLEYPVHRNLLGISDRIYVVDTAGDKHWLTLVHPQENDYVNQQVHLSGGNPEVLTFTQEIDDALLGGTLVIPGYYLPADLSDADDVLPVPDPNWLCIATASEIAFSDIVYEDRAEALNSRSTALWKAMLARNRRDVYGRSRKTPYNVRRIRDTRDS